MKFLGKALLIDNEESASAVPQLIASDYLPEVALRISLLCPYGWGASLKKSLQTPDKSRHGRLTQYFVVAIPGLEQCAQNRMQLLWIKLKGCSGKQKNRVDIASIEEDLQSFPCFAMMSLVHDHYIPLLRPKTGKPTVSGTWLSLHHIPIAHINSLREGNAPSPFLGLRKFIQVPSRTDLVGLFQRGTDESTSARLSPRPRFEPLAKTVGVPDFTSPFGNQTRWAEHKYLRGSATLPCLLLTAFGALTALHKQ
jgi:hypothetical protein